MSEVRRVSVVDIREYYRQTVCPLCGKNVGVNGLDCHEVMMHPEQREKFWTDEYRQWLAEQQSNKKKKKR